MMDTLRHALFSPRAVALVGASGDAAKVNSRPQRVLRQHAYAGRVMPINPAREELGGVRAYPTLRDAPGPIDHAFVMVPGRAVPSVVAECCELKIPMVTIFSAGFAELGEEGLHQQQQMVAMARAAGVRLLGPNCIGLVNVTGHVALTANAVLEREELKSGHLSVISQSGSTLGTLISRAQARGLGFSKLISVGNECDLRVGELTGMLVDDPDTRAILLFLETFRDADNLARAARRAYTAGKPVIAYKLGRSLAGREVATTHTGAMVGADEVADAFFRAHGILRVDLIETLFELPQLVLGRSPPRGKRVSVLTGTGGAAAMVVDRLGMNDIDVTGPPPDVISRLAAKGIAINDARLTDLPMGRSEGGVYSTILGEFLTSDHCDAVVAVLGSSSRYDPKVIVDRIFSVAASPGKPLAVFLAPKADEGLEMLQRAGIAGFRTPETCADAVRAYCEWRAPPDMPGWDAQRVAAARRVLAECKAATLNERDASAVFATLGVECAPAEQVNDAKQRVRLAYPVAAKILSRDIPHKSDAGGVQLDLGDAAALAEAIDRMLARMKAAHPQARIDGVLVQSMVQGVAEIILGYRYDPEVGPVVMAGAGGVLAELAPGHAVRLAPVSIEAATAMIAEVPALAVLKGYRGKPAGDIAALARAIHAVSLLALIETPRVLEAEINPCIVTTTGAVAVDALITVAAQAFL
jgi:acyl-CoA synthetase (NDP forming)